MLAAQDGKTPEQEILVKALVDTPEKVMEYIDEFEASCILVALYIVIILVYIYNTCTSCLYI